MKPSTFLVIIIITSLFGIFVVPVLINVLFKIPAPFDFFEAEWSGGEILAYISGVLSFGSTTFLGFIAFKQNSTLQRIERDNFLASSSCMAFLSSVKLYDFEFTACSLKEEHPEPIVKDRNVKDDFVSFKLGVTLKPVKNYVALVRVTYLRIFAEAKDLDLFVLDAVPIDECFSRVAVFEDVHKFDITALLNQENKYLLEGILDAGGKLSVDLSLDLVSPNFVLTKLKCNGTFCVLRQDYGFLSLETSSPMSFWDGCDMFDKSSLLFRNHYATD